MKALIAIDAGHGMNTGGKQTPKFKDGTIMKEREFNKAVAGYLHPLLEKSGFEVINVAETDVDVPLALRTATANNSPVKNKFNRPADFYISIHADAFGDGGSFNDANGISTFIYKNVAKGSKTEKWAEIIQNRLVTATGRKNRGVKREDLHVVRETSMPACLVECGFMTNLEEAELLRSDTYRRTVAEALAKGICDIFCADCEEANVSKRTPIIGKATATVSQAKAWAKSKGAAELFVSLADVFWEVAQAAGVNPVVVYCQSARETGFGKFGNDVKTEQNNFAGIGATGNGACGNSFGTPKQGIQAQIDHIALYAGAVGYPKTYSYDPRHFSYLLGTAKTVEELSGKWAADAAYGEGIVKMMSELQNTAADADGVPDWQKDAFQKLIQGGVIKTPEYWEKRLGEKITVGEVFAVIANI